MKLEILKFDHMGNGIARSDDKIVFVKSALPSEIVDVEIYNSKKKYMFGNIKQMIKNSDERINSVCPYYDKCGGCNFLHTNKSIEREFKKSKALDLLGTDTDICFYDTNEFNYRNKVILHGDGKKLGFYKEGSNDVIDIDYCYLLDDSINRVIKSLNSYRKSNQCVIREVLIRVGNGILVKIFGDIKDDVIDELFYVDTIILNDDVVKGMGYIEKNISEYKFKISPDSFFQVNYNGLECIYNILKKNIISKYEKGLDLYSGTSVMGILISSFCKKVVSVEVNKSATNDALINIKNNNICNIEIINDKVENVIDSLMDSDLVIVDPPRSGLDKRTITYIKRIQPSMFIYISCDMMSLRRDLKNFEDDYNLKKVYLVNMFPKTYHVETVCFFDKKMN